MLLRHTRWSETQWDEAKGIYTDKDFGFAVVLGHAVLLTHGDFDEELAGIDRETLKRRTLATLRHFAASNRLTGGTQWGRTLFFDTTFQSYFLLAARLLWDDLDTATRSAVETITREQAAYTHSLGTGDDPDSGDWTPTAATAATSATPNWRRWACTPRPSPRAGLGPRRPTPPRLGHRLRRLVTQRGRTATRRPRQPGPRGRRTHLTQHRAQHLRHLHRGEPRLLRTALPSGTVAHLRTQRGPLPGRRPATAPGPDPAAQR
ncbi:hypothetical protein NKH77_00480 [Streptomyces sp. M19]